MDPKQKASHERAVAALAAAKAIKTAHGEVSFTKWDADKQAEFNTYMADFTVANTEYQALKAAADQFALLDTATETYTKPAEGFLGSPILPRSQRDVIQTNHKNAFRKFLSGGTSALTAAEQAAYLSGARQTLGSQEALSNFLPQEKYALVGSVDSLGGFLVPDDVMTELIAELSGLTVVRPLARVRPTARNAASFLTVAGSGNVMYPSGVSGAWRGEGWTTDQANLPTQSQPRFGRERVPVHIWCPDVIELTMELMEDSAVDLDREVVRLLAETRAMDEDSAFLLGTGIGSPKGIITEAVDGNITTVKSGASGAQSWAGLVNIYTSLAAQYRQNATWVFNSYTLGLLLQLEDTEGHLIFPPNSIPDNIFGRPYVVSEFLANGATNGYLPIIFGDFNYYAIADRMDMRIIRLVERFAPNVAIMAVARVGGQVIKTAPFRVQEVGT